MSTASIAASMVRLAAVFLTVLCACTSVLCGCAPAARTGDRPIEMLVPTDAETLDPRYATDAVALRTTRLVHAVAATIAAFQSPKVASRHARVVEDIGTITPDGDAVRITLKRAHATPLTDLEIPILRADEADGPPRVDGSLDGLGPFKVASREGGAIALVPADNAALPKPAHAVTIRTVHDENACTLRMHAGRHGGHGGLGEHEEPVTELRGTDKTRATPLEGGPGQARCRPGPGAAGRNRARS